MWRHETGSIFSEWVMPTRIYYQIVSECLNEMPMNGSQLWGWYVRLLVYFLGPSGMMLVYYFIDWQYISCIWKWRLRTAINYYTKKKKKKIKDWPSVAQLCEKRERRNRPPSHLSPSLTITPTHIHHFCRRACHPSPSLPSLSPSSSSLAPSLYLSIYLSIYLSLSLSLSFLNVK